MATTRIFPLHIIKGKSVAYSMQKCIRYAMNPDKTDGGTLISSYGCDPHTAENEFVLAHKEYQQITGREQRDEVIAYQIRQSFKPGEITPEEANKVGYELAERFLKGKHAFIVATHVDKSHIHNHILLNAVNLDCDRKFRNFYGSSKAVAKISDLICTEHALSMVVDPKPHGDTYDKWLGDRARPGYREQLRAMIDDALAQKPTTFDELLQFMMDHGVEIKRGEHIVLRAPDGKRFIRFNSLGEGYTNDALQAVLEGKKEHTPAKRKDRATTPQKVNLLVDIQAKMQAGKGSGYERWAKVHNLKQMAQTLNYLSEHGLLNYDDLTEQAAQASARFNALSASIQQAEKRMSEIGTLKHQIYTYNKTRDVYVAYRQSGYSKMFYTAHEQEIIQHQAAKKAFDELGMKKLPAIMTLQAEYEQLLTKKQKEYREYQRVRNRLRELYIIKSNIEQILDISKNEQEYISRE